MPLYEYECKDCVKTFEVLHKVDDTIKECTACKSNDITKLISGNSIFKLYGEGFYNQSHKE